MKCDNGIESAGSLDQSTFQVKRMPSKLLASGRFLFAISIAAFGLQHFFYRGFTPGIEPVPASIPGYTVLAYISGALLILASACVIINKKGALAATLLGLMWLLCVVVLHVPRLIGDIHSGGEWTTTLESVCLAGASLALSKTLKNGSQVPGRDGALDKVDRKSVV